MRSACLALKASDRLLAALMALVLFAMMCLGLLDVVFRYLLNSPIPGAAELSALALALIVFGGLPLVTARREHVTVDLLLPDPAKPSGRARLAATNALSAAAVSVLAWRIAQQALDFAEYGDRSSFLKIPLAPVAWFMFAMAVSTALIMLWQAYAGLRPGERGLEDQP